MTPGAHRPAFRDAPTLRTLDMVRFYMWGKLRFVVTVQGVAGSQGAPAKRSSKASRAFLPCFRAVPM